MRAVDPRAAGAVLCCAVLCCAVQYDVSNDTSRGDYECRCMPLRVMLRCNNIIIQ
jgi:hypothetical protein